MRTLMFITILFSLSYFRGTINESQCEDMTIAFNITDFDNTVNIFLLDLCSGKLQQITRSNEQSAYPVWSHNGSQIAFIDVKNGLNHLAVMNPDGTNLQYMSGTIANALYPAWSANNELSFSGLDPVSGRYQLFVVKSDGSDLQRIVETEGNVTYSAWSPDGTKLAFISHLGMNDQKLQIIDTENYSNLGGFHTEGELRNFISWSPDSTTIAYTLNTYVYLLDSIHMLSEKLTYGYDLVWSPDGSKMAFTGRLGQIYVTDKDEHKFVQITSYEGNYLPVWSPDNKYIVFMSDREGSLQLFIMDSDGSNQQKLGTTSPNLREDYPAWKPPDQ